MSKYISSNTVRDLLPFWAHLVWEKRVKGEIQQLHNSLIDDDKNDGNRVVREGNGRSAAWEGQQEKYNFMRI